MRKTHGIRLFGLDADCACGGFGRRVSQFLVKVTNIIPIRRWREYVLVLGSTRRSGRPASLAIVRQKERLELGKSESIPDYGHWADAFMRTAFRARCELAELSAGSD